MRSLAIFAAVALMLPAVASAQDQETIQLEARMHGLLARARQDWTAPVADPNSAEAKNYGRAVEMNEELDQSARDAIVRQYQTAFAQRIGATVFEIKHATYFPQGSNFVVCGSAVFVKNSQRVPTFFTYSSLLGLATGLHIEASDAYRHSMGCDAEARVELTQ